jgi:quercetin dioxygenase-like cupin family protein
MSDVLELPGGVEMRVQVDGEQSGGAFCLLTDVVPPGWSLPAHRHANESETIHITAGRLWLDVDGERLELGPGDTAFVPRDTTHSGGTVGDEPARRVLVFSPAGMEQFFVAMASAQEPDEMLALANSYGWRFG